MTDKLIPGVCPVCSEVHPLPPESEGSDNPDEMHCADYHQDASQDEPPPFNSAVNGKEGGPFVHDNGQ